MKKDLENKPLLSFLTPKEETFFLDYDSTIRQALEKFDIHKFTVVPLVSKEGQYMGSLAEGDILRYIKNVANFDIKIAENKRISDIEIYRPYQPTSINSNVVDVAKLLLNQNFVPLIDDRNCYIGIVKRKAILDELLK